MPLRVEETRRGQRREANPRQEASPRLRPARRSSTVRQQSSRAARKVVRLPTQLNLKFTNLSLAIKSGHKDRSPTVLGGLVWRGTSSEQGANDSCRENKQGANNNTAWQADGRKGRRKSCKKDEQEAGIKSHFTSVTVLCCEEDRRVAVGGEAIEGRAPSRNQTVNSPRVTLGRIE